MLIYLFHFIRKCQSLAAWAKAFFFFFFLLQSSVTKSKSERASLLTDDFIKKFADYYIQKCLYSIIISGIYFSICIWEGKNFPAWY